MKVCHQLLGLPVLSLEYSDTDINLKLQKYSGFLYCPRRIILDGLYGSMMIVPESSILNSFDNCFLGTIECVTPKTVTGIRNILNSSMMDILYYTSPFYRYEVGS